VTYRVRAEMPTPKLRFPVLPARSGAPLAPVGSAALRYLSDDEQRAQIYERTSLCAGDVIDGPAIVREALSTTHIGRRQRATIGRLGEISIELK